MKGIKINRILTISLIAVLTVSVVTTMQFTNNPLIASFNHLIHDAGDVASSSSDSHTAEAATYPLRVTQLSDMKEKVGDAVVVYEDYIDTTDEAIQCESCILIDYTAGAQGEGGVALVFDKIQDLSKAKSVTFFAMGDHGGEKMKIKVAGKKIDKTVDSSLNPAGPFKKEKFGLTTEDVILREKSWQKFSIDLSTIPAKDLSGVSHPFAVELSKQKDVGRQIIYIKSIFYNAELEDKPSIVKLAAKAQ